MVIGFFIIDILEYIEQNRKNNIYGYSSKNFIITIIEQVFDDINTTINDNIVKKLSTHFDNYKDLVKFIHSISNCDDIFSGGDLSLRYNTTNDLLNCRSYKIYKITNG